VESGCEIVGKGDDNSYDDVKRMLEKIFSEKIEGGQEIEAKEITTLLRRLTERE